MGHALLEATVTKAWQGPCGNSVREFMQALHHVTSADNRHETVRRRDTLVPVRDRLRSIRGLLEQRADYENVIAPLIRYKYTAQAEEWAKHNPETLAKYL